MSSKNEPYTIGQKSQAYTDRQQVRAHYKDDAVSNENPYETHAPVEIYHLLAVLWASQSEWSQATFGTDAERGPAGALKHLLHEVDELSAKPRDMDEWADCLLLAMDAARRAGHDFIGWLASAEGLRRWDEADHARIRSIGIDAQFALDEPTDLRTYGWLLDTIRSAADGRYIPWGEVVAAAVDKHGRNKRRTWAKPTTDEPVFHTKEAPTVPSPGGAGR